MNKNTHSPSRIGFIDCAKGITILLVILGHISSAPYRLRYAIFSFHMPLFFLTSGYFIRDHHVSRTFVKSAKNLVIPYVLICGASMATDLILHMRSGTAKQIILRYLKATIGGMSKISRVCTSFESVWLVWFVCCLFCARMLYVLISRLVRPLPARFILVLLVSYLGCRIGEQGYYLPWSFDVAMFAVIYLMAGEILGTTGYFDDLSPKTIWKIFIVPFVLWVVCLLQRNHLELAVRSYGNYICSVVMSVSACVFVLGFSRCLDGINFKLTHFLCWCGKHSIYILAVHLLEMRFFRWERLYELIPVESSWILTSAFHIMCILAVSFPVAYLGNKLGEFVRSRQLSLPSK